MRGKRVNAINVAAIKAKIGAEISAGVKGKPNTASVIDNPITAPRNVFQ